MAALVYAYAVLGGVLVDEVSAWHGEAGMEIPSWLVLSRFPAV